MNGDKVFWRQCLRWSLIVFPRRYSANYLPSRWNRRRESALALRFFWERVGSFDLLTPILLLWHLRYCDAWQMLTSLMFRVSIAVCNSTHIDCISHATLRRSRTITATFRDSVQTNVECNITAGEPPIYEVRKLETRKVMIHDKKVSTWIELSPLVARNVFLSWNCFQFCRQKSPRLFQNRRNSEWMTFISDLKSTCLSLSH